MFLASQVYELAKEQQSRPMDQILNVVKKIYEPFTAEQVHFLPTKLF